MEDFIHLHVHTYYSILDGQSSIEGLVNKAVKDGMKGMAITDHGNMFGVKAFFDYCKSTNAKLSKEGKEPFKPIIGCELYVADTAKEEKTTKRYHLIALAKNYQGYKNLTKIVSRAWVDGFYYKPRTDRADLEKYHEGLIICSACIAGEVPRKILNGDMQGAREAIEWYKKVFGGDYYLELQRHQVHNDDQSYIANRETFPRQQEANKVLLELAAEYDIPVICTNDVHFVNEEHAEAHDHLLCLQTSEDINSPNRKLLYTKQEWFKTREEMNNIFADQPQALRNTIDILNKVEIYDINHDPIMPFFPIPETFGTEEDIRKKYSHNDLLKEFTSDENGENQLPREEGEKKIAHLGGYDKLYRIKFEAEYLKKLTYDGAEKLYNPLTDDVKKRIDFELHTMKTMGFPGYFLIVQDFINSARDELGVLVGPGRGSAAGSVVAYCLGITKIDPIKYDLLFERFLNPDRISLPDIDTDFDDDGRGKVLKWVEDKYGHDKVAHIITYSTMATKNSIKDVARVQKVPLTEVNKLCEAIGDRLPNKLKMNLENAISVLPELKAAASSPDKKIANTIKNAKILEGTIRGTGIHACGTIICRDAISDWVPVSTAEDPDNKGQKVLCTQYDGHVIESTGLIKMDFLGLKTLSELKEAVENIRISQGIDINLDEIPLDDELTYKLYQEGRTIGTFQFESIGMQKHLRELKPTVFEDLIAMNALYRPGPMQYIPNFIERKHNPSLIAYDLPCMEKYLKDTYGITVYQEQVMLLSRLLADFTRGESDTLRKAMGKKKLDLIAKLEPKFIEGGKKNGHDPAILKKIWSDWLKFAEYAFNKSHATCYSWVAFQTAYLKAHYPAEYMAAIMSRRKNDIKEITKLMDECRTMGIHTLGPDVNESFMKFGVNKKGEIRFGLAAIKGIGDSAAQSIITERKTNGPYKSIYDFVERINLNNVNKKALESLALSGGFDGFGIKREDYLSSNDKGEIFLEVLARYGQVYQSKASENQNSLFGYADSVDIKKPAPFESSAWSDLELLGKEKDLIGIYLSAHPLDKYFMTLKFGCNTQCHEISASEKIDELLSKSTVTFGGLITKVFSKQLNSKDHSNDKSKGGQTVLHIITIEDFNGQGELFIRDDAKWEKYEYLLRENNFVYITTTVTKRFPTSKYLNFEITSVEPLKENKINPFKELVITAARDNLNEQMVDELATIVQDNPGNTYINFQIYDSRSGQSISLKSKQRKIDVNKNVINYIEQVKNLQYKLI